MKKDDWRGYEKNMYDKKKPNNFKNDNNGKKMDKYERLLDQNFALERSYFFKDVTEGEWSEIRAFLKEYFSGDNSATEQLNDFVKSYPNLRKGEHNLQKLRKEINEVADHFKSENGFFERYEALMNLILDCFYIYRPTVAQAHFFPNEANEDKVVNMLRTCKQSLDISIFSLTNDKIYAAICEAFKRGVKVRIICDDECVKQFGSDVFKLVAKGIDVKTDSEEKYHMHNKYAIIDQAVVITGSFNWTTQAVKFNQENILFLELKEIVKAYIDNFEHLWKTFDTRIDVEFAKEKVEEDNESRRNYYNNNK